MPEHFFASLCARLCASLGPSLNWWHGVRMSTGLLCLALALPAAAQALPPSVATALKNAGLPADALSVVVAPVDASQPARLRLGADRPVNPASVMKLVTTYAAIDLLGPEFTWATRFYVDGEVNQGLLRGNLHVQGGGDPKWVMERIVAALDAVHAQGVTVIRGDIVLDQSAFQIPRTDPAAFDGERLRPYNAAPEALLVNFKSLLLGFVPDAAAGVARVSVEPPLAGVSVDATVPLSSGPCGDWRSAVQARFDDPDRVSLAGRYPAQCGERTWPVAYADPDRFAARTIEGLWRQTGGLLTGQMRLGPVPAKARLIHAAPSLPLTDIVADVNKFSNNVMAQHVFLTPALQKNGVATWDGAREVLRQWWRQRFGTEGQPITDNGAGLSREARISAQALGRMLQAAWQSPVMPELVASLPVAGIDGTLRRSKSRTGSAHLKTGSLRDVLAVAGYVHADDGRRYVLVAIVNHPQAAAARPVLDALIDWTAGVP